MSSGREGQSRNKHYIFLLLDCFYGNQLLTLQWRVAALNNYKHVDSSSVKNKNKKTTEILMKEFLNLND